MPASNHKPISDTARGAQFGPTSWTNVMAAKQAGSAEAAAALEKLCASYWYPLYAYVRRKGYDPHKAQDLTQEFFYRLLKQNYLGAVDRRRGKFRSFLLAALNHFLSNQLDYERAAKRGGAHVVISLEDSDAETRFLREPALDLSPEKIFERNWFLALFDQALGRLNEEQVAAGRERLFLEVKPFIFGEAEARDYNQVAARMEMTPNAIAVAVHRLRERYKQLVREEIVRTVADPDAVQDELRRFFAMMNT